MDVAGTGGIVKRIVSAVYPAVSISVCLMFLIALCLRVRGEC